MINFYDEICECRLCMSACEWDGIVQLSFSLWGVVVVELWWVARRDF